MKKLNVLGIPVSTAPYAAFVAEIIEAAAARKSDYVCVANVHMLIEAHKNREFAAVVRNAAFVTPDGKPLGWSLRILYGIKQDRVAGIDLTQDLLKTASHKNIPVYFYGGTDDVLTKAKTVFTTQYPGLVIAGTYSPPFRSLTQPEQETIVKEINNSGAGLVFVILGCPKQERWMASMHGKLNAVMVGIGAALPVMMGQYKRAPRWIRESGFEWLFRLVLEPRRLFKRYLVTNSIFLYLLLKACFRKLFYGNSLKPASS